MKKYNSIVRYGHRATNGVINEGDYIVVMEKLDGANASFELSEDGTTVLAYSRNNPLDESNNLRGFYQWVQANVNPNDLIPDTVYFGEWLVKHKADYGINGGQEFYLFDLYDKDFQAYVTIDIVLMAALDIKVQVAPILYAGKYKSYEHLTQFVNRSVLSENGEGIVVKNYDYLDKDGDQMFVKLVSESFAELQPQKSSRDPNISHEGQFIRTHLTQARVEKIIWKLVDEGRIPEWFGLEDMGELLKVIGPVVLEDILKEEMESIPIGFEIKEARKSVGKVLPPLVKGIISSR